MAWFRFNNQTRWLHKDNVLPFWQLHAFSTLRNKQLSSFLSVSLSLALTTESQICHLNGSERDLRLVSRRCDAGFLCEPVELPVFQHRKGRLSKHREFEEAYCTADPSFTGWALSSQRHSPATPHDPLKLGCMSGCWKRRHAPDLFT